MGQGLGPVQKAVVRVLSDAREDLTVEEITARVFRILGNKDGYGGWRNAMGVPLEHHYSAVRRALATLDEHEVPLSVRVRDDSEA